MMNSLRSNDVFQEVSPSVISRQHVLMDFIRVDDLEAEQKVSAHNQSVLINIAKHYSDHGVSFFEIVREGNRGLAQAMDSFELEGSFRFAAYAARCVRQNIECAIMNQMEPE